jgi:DNA-binding NtrC family response regulator
MMKTILLIDDEEKLLRILQSSLEKKGFKVNVSTTGQGARQKISEHPADIVFLDMMLPDTTGLDLLHEFVPLYPNKVFIMMTAYGNVESAVIAMKAGAFDYITKPAKLDEILIVAERAFEWIGMKQENLQLKEKLELNDSKANVLGVSSAMQNILQLIERVSNTSATVLLEGESGTGKSMLARKIHQMSDRMQAPFISVNCAAIPDQLLESELFGYEKGAFTGASTSRAGKFEAAEGGTIFLDEIGEISSSLQAKLLQVTQEKSFMKLGSNTQKHVDVRIIAATNRNLSQLVKKGDFREDLYYRLNIVDIRIPSLRERIEDIPLLIEQFLESYRKLNQRDYHISKELIQVLIEYPWPGNVRELENAIERAVVLSRDEKLSIEDFPREIRESRLKDIHILESEILDPLKPLPDRIDKFEKQIIIEMLKETEGPAAAARKLGITRQSLLYKMNKYGIQN